MKAIRVTFDEGLLEKLDLDDEVRRVGRSEVLRRAALEYLQKKRKAEIAEAYRKAYGGGSALGSDFEGWEDEGVWPKE